MQTARQAEPWARESELRGGGSRHVVDCLGRAFRRCILKRGLVIRNAVVMHEAQGWNVDFCLSDFLRRRQRETECGEGPPCELKIGRSLPGSLCQSLRVPPPKSISRREEVPKGRQKAAHIVFGPTWDMLQNGRNFKAKSFDG